jgi:hypothetical protein
MASAGEVIQGGVQLYAGGITQIDSHVRRAAWASRCTRAHRPMRFRCHTARRCSQRKEELLGRAFYLNKLRQLPLKDDMTAYEASVWTKDYIREALPLFSPLESQYNAQVCEQTFSDLMRANAFGPWGDIPESIRGRDTEWKFESPLSQAIERQKSDRFLEARELIAAAAELDPSAPAVLDAPKALREALTGRGTPPSWLRSERDVEKHAAAVQAQQAQQAQQQQIAQGASTAVDAGKAAESFAKVA